MLTHDLDDEPIPTRGCAINGPDPEPRRRPPDELLDLAQPPTPTVTGTALVPITTPDDAPTLAMQLVAYEVTSPETYAAAADLLKVATQGLAFLDEFFDADIARAYATHKGLTQKKAHYAGPLKAAIDALKARGVSWAQEQERERQAEQRRQDDSAFAERRLHEANIEAERLRLEADADRLADAGFDHAAAASRLRANEIVEEIRQAPPPVAAPVESTIPKATGVAVKEHWGYRIHDKRAFVRAVASGEIPLDAIEENAIYLRGMARMNRDALRWPGVSWHNVGSMAVRRGR